MLLQSSLLYASGIQSKVAQYQMTDPLPRDRLLDRADGWTACVRRWDCSGEMEAIRKSREETAAASVVRKASALNALKRRLGW